MRIIIILCMAIMLTCCAEQVAIVKDTSIDLTEGRLVYSISGEGTTSSWELEILFNEENAVIREQFARGAANKYIYDKKSNEIMGLIDEVVFLGIKKGSYIIYYTPERLIQVELSSHYGDTLITKTQNFKDIMGYKCQKSIIKHGEQATVEVWTTDKIKSGIIYPWTPLTYESIALEYEFKINGRIDRRYIIKSISDKKIDPSEFEHIALEKYHLIVPASVYSIRSNWAKDFQENPYNSFTYPFYDTGRQSTIDFIYAGLSNIIQLNEEIDINIKIIVNDEGSVDDVDVSINYSRRDERIEAIEMFIRSMNKWTPAKVKGKPVRSEVTIFA
jgi:Domain of unknown function (DUF4412)